MALVIPNGFANWTLTITNNGGGASGESSISFGMETITPPLSQGEVNGVANAMRDSLKTLWDNQWELGPVHVIENAGGPPFNVWDDFTQEAGTHAADTYSPPQVACVVSKQTGIAGRAYRGRVYLPGVPDGYAGEDGGINPTYVNEVNTAFAAMKTNVLALLVTSEFVLFHDSESASAAFPPATIQSFAARDIQGTMRPRLRR